MVQCLSLTAGDRPSGICCYVSTPPLPLVHKQLFVCSNFVSIYHAGSAPVIYAKPAFEWAAAALFPRLKFILNDRVCCCCCLFRIEVDTQTRLCNIAAADAIAAGHATALGIQSMYFYFAFAQGATFRIHSPAKKCIRLWQQPDTHLGVAKISRPLNWLHWWACNTILRKMSYVQLEGRLYLRVQMPFVNKASFSVCVWRRCGSQAFQSYQDVVHRVLQIAALSPGCTHWVKLINACVLPAVEAAEYRWTGL